MIHVLIVEDDPAIVKSLEDFLRGQEMQVTSAGGQEEALRKLQERPYDLVLLDITLPDGSGYSVCNAVKRDYQTPVIFLTASGDENSVVTGFDLGAENYIAKPFRPRELVSRIRAVLRRTAAAPKPYSAADRLVCGDLVLDRVALRVFLKAREVTLTPKASMLLDYLMTHPGELHTRERLLAALWGIDFASSTRAVDHRIREIRRVLGDDPTQPTYIETVPSVGYRFIGAVRA